MAKRIKKISNVGKIRKYVEKSVFFSKKKRSHLLKLHLCQIGKAQNMPVIASRLVTAAMKEFLKRLVFCKKYISVILSDSSPMRKKVMKRNSILRPRGSESYPTSLKSPKNTINMLNTSLRKKHAIVPNTNPGFKNRAERNRAHVQMPFMSTTTEPNFHPSGKNELRGTSTNRQSLHNQIAIDDRVRRNKLKFSDGVEKCAK